MNAMLQSYDRGYSIQWVSNKLINVGGLGNVTRPGGSYNVPGQSISGVAVFQR